VHRLFPSVSDDGSAVVRISRYLTLPAPPGPPSPVFSVS
jgi:hypothetical protein